MKVKNFLYFIYSLEKLFAPIFLLTTMLNKCIIILLNLIEISSRVAEGMAL